MNRPATTRGLDFDALLDVIVDRVASRVAERLTQAPANGRTMNGPRLLTVAQAAEYLGRTESGIRHMVSEGWLPVVRADRRVFLDIRDLDDWIVRNKTAV